MKLMIVGLWRYEIYEKSFASALSDLGVQIIPCKIKNFFTGKLGRLRHILPVLDFLAWKINKKVIDDAKIYKPDFILFWRPTYIYPKTLKVLSSLDINIISYNNDDPFSLSSKKNVPIHHYLLWYFYKKCLRHFDTNFFYRSVNVKEAILKGIKNCEILLPYFIPQKDYPVQLSKEERDLFSCEVVFVGHCEPDGRAQYIEELLINGFKVKIWGYEKYWKKNLSKFAYKEIVPIKLVDEKNYSKILCSANICLAFLSKLNRDTYTRRCFEIPATGSLMLAERTQDLMNMFEENVEACFFSSKEEMISKVKWLINNPKIREKISNAGLRRVWRDKHDVLNRAKYFLSKIKKNKKKLITSKI